MRQRELPAGDIEADHIESLAQVGRVRHTGAAAEIEDSCAACEAFGDAI